MRAVPGRAIGIVFVVIAMTFVWLTYAIYTKKFVDVVAVELRTNNIGLQLNNRADVKIRGVIVGEVRSVDTSSEGAVLNLALDPDRVEDIPANVSALILPKTLFGEKYVALQMPGEPAPTSVEEGGVIAQASVPIEVEEVLSDLYPLLQAVEPVDLANTLNAFATALDGRGDRIGDNFVRLDGYLEKINPLVPTLVEDLAKLGEVSDVYADAMPDLARLLENTTVTGNTLVSQEQELNALLTDVDALADTTRVFLEDNGDGLIEVTDTSVPITDLFAEYSPEYPCLLEGLTNFVPRVSETFRGYTLHINLEVLPTQPSGYSPADDPTYAADLGPACQALPAPTYSQENPGPQPPPEVFEKGGVSGPHNKFRASPADSRRWLSDRQPLVYQYVSTRERLAPSLGLPQHRVSDLSALLLGQTTAGPVRTTTGQD